MKRSRSDFWFERLAYMVLTLSFLIVIVPLLNMIAVSLSGEASVMAGKIFLWPKDFQLKAFSYVLSSSRFHLALRNNVELTVLGVIVSMFATCTAGYALSRKHLSFRRLLMVYFVFSMLFNGGIIPTYLLVMKLKLINSFWSLVLVSSVSVYNLLIMKNYFEGLPEEIEESSRIDGASHLKTFFSIMLPLAMPVCATIGLFYAVSFWNEYFNAKLYITRQQLNLLQPYLQAVIFEASDPAGAFRLDASKLQNVGSLSLVNATVLCAMAPICIVYPFLQKYFVTGIVLGSVKG